MKSFSLSLLAIIDICLHNGGRLILNVVQGFTVKIINDERYQDLLSIMAFRFVFTPYLSNTVISVIVAYTFCHSESYGITEVP